ncbi:hypothetical protein FPSE_02986 [Fusarium pseudograminearum CS3096]|uniref:Uncharacterized protein n=1 Tax=Fusarium pseudograminearum (strain CS3096) TaxID=1028729 RepID=K3W203_FUSPC|nr:hypothetical protein FPSE_02986 [Fusarium pseudograminearum CS3096]EKJ76800.1 hypothetical protein FPSE_02986 [Fusarium pseudograminearum CS3096]
MPAHRTGVGKVTLKEGSKNPESGSLPVVYNSSFLDLPTSLCNALALAHKNSRLGHLDTTPMPLALQPTILALHAQIRAVMTLP